MRGQGHRLSRRGNYHLVMVYFLTAGMGLAALSIDLAWMRVVAAQCQGVADAAAAAALIELRRTGDIDLATEAANEFVARNVVGDEPAELLSIEFGRWDEEDKEFAPDPTSPHAVNVSVGRPTDNPLGLYFARLAGWDDFTVERASTSATRSMQVIVVFDITGSFEADIAQARAASLQFLDLLEATHGEFDMVGMVLYYYAFGVEYTPLRYLDDEAADHVARTAWEKIHTASKPNSSYFATGGKHPDMPREYPDESGTDHHVGLEMAIQMFSEHPDPLAFRAIVVVTDGVASGLASSSNRATHPYTETRWRVFTGPTPYSVAQIQTATLDSASRAWEQEEANIWLVSYDAQAQFLIDTTEGVGQFYYTENPADFATIFAEIASALPIATVR